MSALPRILPLVAVAIGGVLVVKVLDSAGALPSVFSSAKAFAEGTVAPKAAKPAAASAAPAAAPAKPAAVCAPTAAELARAAGLSPAELQVLQSLGARRGQLDLREQGLETQIALMSAAEAKVDAKLAALAAMKREIAALITQVDARQQAETDRLVKVFEAMKPKDAAARFTLLDDRVRLPIAAKMKERALSAMLAQMTPPEAKRLTEALAARFAASQAVAAGRAATAPTPPAQTAAAAPATPTATPAPATETAAAQPTPKPAAPRKPKPPRTAAASATAAVGKPATPAPAKPRATAQADTAAAAPAKPTAAPAPAKPAAPAPAKPATPSATAPGAAPAAAPPPATAG